MKEMRKFYHQAHRVDDRVIDTNKKIKKLDLGNWISNGKYYMIRCPRCLRENYAMNVAHGECAWCGHKGSVKE